MFLFVEVSIRKGGMNMKEYLVTFNFGKDNNVNYLTQGESRESVLENFTSGMAEGTDRFCDFVYNDVHYRIDREKVNYVSVKEYHGPNLSIL